MYGKRICVLVMLFEYMRLGEFNRSYVCGGDKYAAD